MIVLDENFQVSQREQLRGWRIRFRHVGTDLLRRGADDTAEIVPMLHGLAKPTFFTGDRDFYDRALRHRAYCIVFLDVDPLDRARFTRRCLRHPRFCTWAQRQGSVVHVGHDGVRAWLPNGQREESFAWPPRV